MENNVSPIFNSNIPKWLAKILLFILLVPNMVMFFLPVANVQVAAGYFGIEPNEVAFTITLYYIGFVSFYSLERRFYSFFTYKRYFIIFQLIQLLCCLILFSSTNLYVIYAVRFFQGMLFASAVNLYLSMMAMKIKTFRAKEVSYSLFFGMLLCTSSFNNLITADLIDQFNFNFLFQCVVLLYAINLLIVLCTMKINIEARSMPLVQLDFPSFGLLSVVLLGIGYCSVFGQQYYWLQSKKIQLVITISLVALIVFVVRQFTLKRPYIELKILSFPKYLIGVTLLFLMYICRFSFLYSGQFFNSVLGMDPRHVSYMYLINLFGIISGVGFSCIHLIKKRPIFIVWIIGFFSLFYYHFLMNQRMFYYGNETSYFLPMFLHGVGIGLIMVPTILYCISSVAYYMAPSAAALCLFVRYLGYTCSGILTNYYTLFNTSSHKDRFLDYFQKANPLYVDRFTTIKTKLLKNGYSQYTVDKVTQSVLNKELDKYVLLRSVMDYYTLMMYVSLGVLMFLIVFWLFQKKIKIVIRPILPI